MNRRYRIVVALGGVLLAAGCQPKADREAPPPPKVSAGASVEIGPQRPAAVADVLRELEQAALKTVPESVPSQGYLYRRSEEHDGGHVGVLEEWDEIEGLIPVKLRQDGRDVERRPSLAEAAATQRAELARAGAGVDRPTPAWLEGLPGDPDGLNAKLANERLPEAPAATAGALFFKADPLLPAKVRAGLVRLIGTTPGLSAAELTIGGRKHFVLRYTSYGATRELYFNAADARAAGVGPAPGQLHLWTFDIRKELP